MRAAALAIIGLLASTTASAATKDGDYTVLGPGVHSCGSWLKERKTDSPASLAQETWVLGYISGFNAFRDSGGNVTKGTDANGVYAWIDAYCQAHPLETLAKATDGAAFEMLLKAH